MKNKRLRVGHIVRKTNSYWLGELNEIDEGIGELYVIIEAEGADYGIAKLDNFEDQSWWWNNKNLEFVRDGFNDEYRKFLDYENDYDEEDEE